MKIATWNVNSLNVRLPHLLQWLADAQPDVVALQELKLVDEVFPHAALAEAGYAAVSNGQKTYNGVALLARAPLTLEDVSRDLPGFEDLQKRVIAATVGDLRVVSVYVVNGQSVGSGPSLWLASRRRVSALVLHTPLLSGLRVLIPPSQGFCSVGGCCSPVCMYALCDAFPNLKRIRRVSAPVLLVHGTADRTVDCSHSLTLYERIPQQHRREPYIIDGAGHENVVDFDVNGYFSRVTAFLRSVPQQDATSTTAASGPNAALSAIPPPDFGYNEMGEMRS